MAVDCKASAALLGPSILSFFLLAVQLRADISVSCAMRLRLSFVFKGQVNLGFLFQNDVQSKINCFGKEEPQIYNVSLPMDEGFIGICRSLTWTSHL